MNLYVVPFLFILLFAHSRVAESRQIGSHRLHLQRSEVHAQSTYFNDGQSLCVNDGIAVIHNADSPIIGVFNLTSGAELFINSKNGNSKLVEESTVPAEFSYSDLAASLKLLEKELQKNCGGIDGSRAATNSSDIFNSKDLLQAVTDPTCFDKILQPNNLRKAWKHFEKFFQRLQSGELNDEIMKRWNTFVSYVSKNAENGIKDAINNTQQLGADINKFVSHIPVIGNVVQAAQNSSAAVVKNIQHQAAQLQSNFVQLLPTLPPETKNPKSERNLKQHKTH